MGKATIIEAQNSSMQYEDGKAKGILGKLKGIFADYKHGTRNSDRLYTEELWDNRVFGSEDVMEALETKTLFGELDHPEGDRCETLAKNAAITITKLEKRPEEGVIYGEAEILDTPTGRIVKALADSGAKLGISSRGMGEEIYREGKNIIDPDTYDFITFDVVVTPANTKARVALTESKEVNKLTENLEREINESTTTNQLDQLNNVVKNIFMNDRSKLLEKIQNKKESLQVVKSSNKLIEANQFIAIKLLKEKLISSQKELQESLQANSELSKENITLMEESKFYKESRNNLQNKYKQTKKELNEANNNISNLNKTIESKDNVITSLNEKLELNKVSINKLNESKNNEIASKKQLNEAHNKEITVLNNKISKILLENDKISKNAIHSSKILSESLKKNSKLEEENKKINELNAKYVQTINSLREEVKSLKEENLKSLEVEKRFSKLAFDPIGTLKLKQESVITDSYTDEDRALYEVLTNKK